MTNHPADDFMTPTEAARTLKVSVTTIYRLIESNRMPGPIRVGHQWRISRRALETAVAVWETPRPAPITQRQRDLRTAAARVLRGRDRG